MGRHILVAIASRLKFSDGKNRAGFVLARCVPMAALVATAIAPQAVLANSVGENVAWQFQTSADKINRAAIEDIRQKKQSGYYAAPVYNTTIDRQYNCNVSSVAAGSQGTSTAIGNSPSSAGHSASSTGNTDTASLTPGFGASTSSLSGSQTNAGEVNAGASGSVETVVDGNSYQTLNTTQDNSGAQSASVSASNACQFASPN